MCVVACRGRTRGRLGMICLLVDGGGVAFVLNLCWSGVRKEVVIATHMCQGGMTVVWQLREVYCRNHP
jgi:hypothetical protein